MCYLTPLCPVLSSEDMIIHLIEVWLKNVRQAALYRWVLENPFMKFILKSMLGCNPHLPTISKFYFPHHLPQWFV